MSKSHVYTIQYRPADESKWLDLDGGASFNDRAGAFNFAQSKFDLHADPTEESAGVAVRIIKRTRGRSL